MHVHGLDELSLLYIFDLLPIPDLLIAGQVCARWNAFRAKSGLTRHSLTLLLGGEGAREYVHDSLFVIPRYWQLLNDDGSRMFPDGTYDDDLNKRIVLNLPDSFNLGYAQFLVELFPTISNFVVGIDIETGHILNQITYMLMQWSSSLVSLKIFDAGYDDNKYKMSDLGNVDTHLRLLQAVNGLSSLVLLEFAVNFSLIKDLTQDRIDLPILAQLEQFKFYTADECDYIFDSLKQYGESNGRLKIYLQSLVELFGRLTTLPPEFSSRFCHLEVLLKGFNIDAFISLTDHFTHLTTLAIMLDEIDPMDVERQLVFGPLAPLTQLVDLTLCIDGRVLDSLQYFEDEQQEDYVQLKSVKVLTLCIEQPQLSTHEIFWELDFGWLFPKLQIVHFDREKVLCDQCTAYGYNVRKDYGSYCLKTMIKPFRECAQLQLVSTDDPSCTTPREWLPDNLQDDVEDDQEEDDYGDEDYGEDYCEDCGEEYGDDLEQEYDDDYYKDYDFNDENYQMN